MTNNERAVLKELSNNDKRKEFVRNRDHWDITEQTSNTRTLEFTWFGLHFLKVQIRKRMLGTVTIWVDADMPYAVERGVPTNAVCEAYIVDAIKDVQKSEKEGEGNE